VRAAIVLASLVFILALDVFASARVIRSDLISQPQKVAWLLFAWLVPILGATLALQVSRELDTPSPITGASGLAGSGAEGATWVSGDAGGCGHGDGGGCGDGGGDGGGH
jgi:hypothetical protein